MWRASFWIWTKMSDSYFNDYKESLQIWNLTYNSFIHFWFDTEFNIKWLTFVLYFVKENSFKVTADPAHVQANTAVFRLWIHLCFWTNPASQWFIKRVTCFVVKWISRSNESIEWMIQWQMVSVSFFKYKLSHALNCLIFLNSKLYI